MSAVRMSINKVLLYRGRSNWIFLLWHASNNPRKEMISEDLRGNRFWCQSAVPILMGDFAKFKILECSTIGQQMNWIEPRVPTTFVILFLYVIGVNEYKSNGPEMIYKFV